MLSDVLLHRVKTHRYLIVIPTVFILQYMINESGNNINHYCCCIIGG